ncbi:MAG: sodium:solute symporter [Wenzhouxiangellaceae bacterium]
MPEFNLSTLDSVIVLAYFAFVVYLGVRIGHGQKNTEDYFLAGRSMIWPFVGLSLYASNMTSTSLVGLSGDAYATGISVFNYEWMAVVVLVIFAVFFLPLYLSSRVYTMPEFLERRYDARSRYYFAAITLIGNIVIDTAGTLFAGAILISLIFPAMALWQIILLLSLVAGFYTILGGLKAVIYTDAVQVVLLLAGAVVVSVIAYQQVGGWEPVQAVTSPEMLSLIRPLDDPGMPWPALLFGVPLLGFYFWCTNQFMVQRILSAKNTDHGRWGVLFAAALKLPVIFIMVFPGTMARVLYPDLSQPDLVYPTMLFDLLPAGLLGLVVAGFIAAVMSSLDSTLNSASTLVTMDFVRPLKPQLDQQQLLRVGRWVTFVFMLLAAAWAPQIASFESLFKYLQGVLSYIAPPIVALFFLGVLWPRANAQGAFATLMVGLLLSIIHISGRVLEAQWLPDLGHFLYVAPVLLVICLLTHVVVSLATTPPDAQRIAPYLWTRQLYAAESAQLRRQAWYQNYRILSVLLLIATAILVYRYR